MLKINENNRIDAKDIYSFVEVKTRFHAWLKRCLEYADLKDGEDFVLLMKQSTGGRPETSYEFTIDAAKEICIVSATSKAKELRRWLIGLSKQRDNLELVTVKEAAFAMKVVNCLKYIENQKEAYSIHKNSFVEENNDKINPKYIYAEFAKYRAKIVGWDKEKTDKAINEYLNEHSGYNRNRLLKEDMPTKISIMDIGEAIRIAVLDILYSKNEDSTLAENFSILCKKLAKEMEIKPDKENSKNLFRDKEQLESVKSISLK
jgi:phage anti-repressor protein